MRCLSALAATVLIAPAAAVAEVPPGDEQGGVLTFVLENDLFSEAGADKNYTNGIKLSWMSAAGQEPAWARQLADTLPFAPEELDMRIEFEVGQTMFTPEVISTPIPDPNDRPYAGLLYASAGFIVESNRRTLEQTQLVLGVVGPEALAEQAQRSVHRAINGVEPRGWDSQIPTRIAGEVRYQRTQLMWRVDRPGGLDLDLSPHAGFTLGNLTTSANAGLGFRVGNNLPRDFGPPRIAPSLPGSGYFVPTAPLGWYVFGGLDGRYMAYSLVLDERSSLNHKVTREPWVGDFQVGGAVVFGDVRLAYTHVFRTREFVEQREELSEFGALSITWRL